MSIVIILMLSAVAQHMWEHFSSVKAAINQKSVF